MSTSFGQRSAGSRGSPYSASSSLRDAHVTKPEKTKNLRPKTDRVVRANAKPILAKRFLGSFIDLMIWGILIFVFSYLFFSETKFFEGMSTVDEISDEKVLGFYGVFGLIVFVIFAYGTIMEWCFGATVGKFVAGTRVMTSNGQSITLLRSAIRNFSKFITWAIPMNLAYFLLFLTPDNQTLHDILSGTHVYDASDVQTLKIGQNGGSPEARAWARETTQSYQSYAR